MKQNHYNAQRGLTLIELMLTLVVSAIIITLGAMYARSVYRGNLVNQGEQLVVQVLAIAKSYHTAANAGGVSGAPQKQYYGINTTWVGNDGNIPSEFLQVDYGTNTVSISQPWSNQPSIDVYPGSNGNNPFNDRVGDTYVYIQVANLPNYACEGIKNHFLGELGGGKVVNGKQVTYIACKAVDGSYTLQLATDPLLY